MATAPWRKHHRSNFFKYTSARTAKCILEGQCFRWSSPILFNDPFDVPRELTINFRSPDIVAASRRHIASLIENPPDDTSELKEQLHFIVDTIKRGVATSDKQKIIASLSDGPPMDKADDGSLREFREMWRQTIPEMRILCLTESPAHVR